MASLFGGEFLPFTRRINSVKQGHPNIFEEKVRNNVGSPKSFATASKSRYLLTLNDALSRKVDGTGHVVN
jgi:hypothetical protein